MGNNSVVLWSGQWRDLHPGLDGEKVMVRQAILTVILFFVELEATTAAELRVLSSNALTPS